MTDEVKSLHSSAFNEASAIYKDSDPMRLYANQLMSTINADPLDPVVMEIVLYNIRRSFEVNGKKPERLTIHFTADGGVAWIAEVGDE